jgi:phage-related protein
MGFYASSFQYKNIPSETFNLRISSTSSSGMEKSMGSTNMEVISQKIFRRPRPFLLGMTPSPVMSFGVEITSPDYIDAETFQKIQAWLFSSRTYDKLMVFQPDIQNSYFNCIFNNPETIYSGNRISGVSATVECDSPFAWEFAKTTTYTYTVPIVDSTIVFNNRSDDTGNYLYPNLVITINSLGSSVSITNSDDSSRVFSFTGLSPSEVLTINNDLQTISSSTGLKRMSTFNKNFLRLVPYLNHLQVQGNVSSIQITTQFARKISG